MPRRSTARALSVWMNGERVGEWTYGRGEHRFRYDEQWFESPRARPISLSLPLRPTERPYHGAIVEAFFDNLLPDNDQIRTRMMARYATESTRPFDLLAEAGRDCVGAIQLLPLDAAPPDIHEIRGRRLTPGAIGELLSEIRTPTMGARDDDDFRVSIAGAQEKTALLRHGGRWMVPEGTTPTTHIFKLPIDPSDPFGIDLSRSVDNEWLCSRILTAYGIPCARCEISRFGDFRVLVVERFDRRLAADGEWWIRLPQEDFCQATGTPPARKYERDGGPGIRRSLELLLGAEDAVADRTDFFRTQFVFWLLGAIDGHAKNFSVFIEPGGRYRLTPRYDVLSAHPLVGKGRGRIPLQKLKVAMAVSGRSPHYRWREIHTRHWLETARACGVPDARSLIADVVGRTPAVLERVEQELTAEIDPATAEAVLKGVRTSADQMGEELVTQPH